MKDKVETCRASLVVPTASDKLFFNNLIFYMIRRSRTHGLGRRVPENVESVRRMERRKSKAVG